MKSRHEFNSEEDYKKYFYIYFAEVAMRSLLRNEQVSVYCPSMIVGKCIGYADALFKQLKMINYKE